VDTESNGQKLLKEQQGLRNVLRQLVRAILGLAVSYLLARSFTDMLFGTEQLTNVRLVAEVGTYLATAGVALTISNVIPVRRDLARIAQVVDDSENELRDRSRSQRFQSDVHAAFEMAENEQELFDVAAAALAESGDAESEILVADASQAHAERSVVAADRPAPGCAVSTPSSCPAVRRGQTLTFEDPKGLASCPRLRERDLPSDVRATCIPITVLGTPSAVLHAVQLKGTGDYTLQTTDLKLEGVAVNFGTRLGTIRAMSQSQLQADTDPLTGLLNRRATENRVRKLRSDQKSFAVAMADLDHFKQLNDTFGHDTGDRALRLFSKVLNTAVRDSDIVCRHGGEEFVIVLPGANVITAAAILHRLREDLVSALNTAQVPPFTVSIGLADSTTSTDYQEILNAADDALMRAKSEGRDRIVIGDSAAYQSEDLELPTAG
jgi:diguanylate cyclase (GGDEF)-like protein